MGVLPPPSMVGAFTGDLKQLAEAGKAFDRQGLTRAGRALDKHGGREGRSVFPKPKGPPQQKNIQGQEMLEKILNQPEKQITTDTFERYGTVIDIRVPNLGGARFSGDGKQFIGFLEP